jgi:hypothetical protein
MAAVVLPRDFDAGKLAVGPLQDAGPHGGKRAVVTYAGGPLVLQTPELRAPFGTASREGQVTLDVSLDGHDGASRAVKDLFDALAAVDAAVLCAVPATMRQTPSVRPPKAGGNVVFAPTFKMALPWRDNRCACDVFDERRALTREPFVGLAKRSHVRALVLCVGVWASRGRFGCNWRVQVLQVLRTPARLPSYAFAGGGEDAGEDSDID